MSLFVPRPFFSLSVAGASAILLLSTGSASKIQADDFGLRDFALTFDLGHKDPSPKSDDGKSSHDPFESYGDKGGDSFGHGGDDFGGSDKGHGRDNFFTFSWDDKDKGHDKDRGSQDSGNCWSNPTCGDGNHGGKSCGGDPNGGDPNGGGAAVPEPASTYLSFIAASAMALLLAGRNLRQRGSAKRA